MSNLAERTWRMRDRLEASNEVDGSWVSSRMSGSRSFLLRSRSFEASMYGLHSLLSLLFGAVRIDADKK